MPDAEAAITHGGIRDSFTGCAGQRCMAASVLLAIGDESQCIALLMGLNSQGPRDLKGMLETFCCMIFLKFAYLNDQQYFFLLRGLKDFFQ